MTPIRLLIPSTPKETIAFYRSYKRDSLLLIDSVLELGTEDGRMFVRAMETADRNVQKLKIFSEFTHPSDSSDAIATDAFRLNRRSTIMLVMRRYLLNIMNMIQVLRNEVYKSYGVDFMQDRFSASEVGFAKYDDGVTLSEFLKKTQEVNANLTQTISDFEFRYQEPCALCTLSYYGKTK